MYFHLINIFIFYHSLYGVINFQGIYRDAKKYFILYIPIYHKLGIFYDEWYGIFYIRIFQAVIGRGLNDDSYNPYLIIFMRYLTIGTPDWFTVSGFNEIALETHLGW